MNYVVPPAQKVEPVVLDDSQVACPACPHDIAAHDRIGLRFCAVTTSKALERGCVCSRG